MDVNYYKQQLVELADLTEKSASKQLSFFQSLLIVSVTLLGILISLHDSTTETLLFQVLFAVAIGLISLGILLIVIVLYDWSMMLEKARQKFVVEAQNALKENRQLNPVYINRGKYSLIFVSTRLNTS